MKFIWLCVWPLLLTSTTGLGASVNRRIIAELDPVAPASASYEQQKNGVTTNKFGAAVDFNIGGVLSTGPEFCSGPHARYTEGISVFPFLIRKDRVTR